MIDIGIIEKEKNPFSCQPWVEQGLEFTESVRRFLPPLLGKDERIIRNRFSMHDGTKIAFIAIRWGYAQWVDGKLEATEKWDKELQAELDRKVEDIPIEEFDNDHQDYREEFIKKFGK